MDNDIKKKKNGGRIARNHVSSRCKMARIVDRKIKGLSYNDDAVRKRKKRTRREKGKEIAWIVEEIVKLKGCCAA